MRAKDILSYSSAVLLAILIVAGSFFLVKKIQRASADGFLPMDFNQDGIVDVADIDLIKQNYANTAGGILNPSSYDLNNDRKIDALDLAIVEDNQGNGTDPNRDWDQDGWAVARGDCQDRDKSINPVAEEKADNGDNNCNGNVDEFVDHQSLISSEVYGVNVHFDNAASNKVSVNEVEIETISEPRTTTYTTGEYALVARDRNNKLLDVVGFSNCLNGEFLEAELRTSERSSCDVRVSIPKTDSVDSLSVVSLIDESTNIPIDLKSISFFPTAKATMITIRQCEGGMKKYAMNCGYTDDITEQQKNALVQTFDRVASIMPYLTMVPLRDVIMADSAIATPCSDDVIACTDTAGSITFVWPAMEANTDIAMQVIVAHELSHHLQFTFNTYGDILPGHDYGDFMKNKVSELVRYIDEANCKYDARKCALDPGRLISEWINYSYEISGYGIIDENPAWSNLQTWEDINNPASHKSDPWGPRPGERFGVTRSYGEKNAMERWATMFEGIFLDESGVDRSAIKDLNFPQYEFPMSSLKSIYKAKPIYPDVTELSQGMSILGRHGLIKDWDHDGVTDEYDNCSSRTFPQTCTTPTEPDQQSRCYNPDQVDLVHRDGSLGPDGVGDACDLPPGSCFTACDAQGYVCRYRVGESGGGGSGDGGVICDRNPVVPRGSSSEYCNYAEPVFVDPTVPHSMSLGDVCVTASEERGEE